MILSKGSEMVSMTEHVRYVFTREGSLPASIPADIAESIRLAARPTDDLERSLDLAGLVMLRLGHDGGSSLLRHWQAYDPTLLRDVDPVLVDVLAHTPELITGALRA